MTDSIAQVVADIREILGMLERTGMAKITSSDLSGWADRLDAIASQQGWQTIETAPKDGTRVLISTPSEGVKSSTFENGLWQGLLWRANPRPELHAPTHWRPLPPAPHPTADGDAK